MVWPEDFGWPQDIGALGILDGSRLLERMAVSRSRSTRSGSLSGSPTSGPAGPRRRPAVAGPPQTTRLCNGGH
jgi:hypothetical protein